MPQFGYTPTAATVAKIRAAAAARRRPAMERFLERFEPDPFGGCWLWTAGARKNAFNYGVFCVDGEQHPAHRWAWLLFRGPIPEGLFVCHRCDVPACVNPDHLFLGTPGDNIRDAVSKGRWPQRPPRACKLTKDQALAVAEGLAAGELQSRLAARFGVGGSAVYNIAAGLTWSGVTRIPLREIRPKRPTRLLSWRGDTRTVAEWAALLGVAPAVINTRLKAGWSLGTALTTPKRSAPTHCIHGHEFTPQNTAQLGPSRRGCRLCMSAAQRRYAEKKRLGQRAAEAEARP